MKKILSLATALFFGSLAFSGVAHAALEQISLGSASNNFTFYSKVDTITPNIDLSTVLGDGQLVLTHNAELVNVITTPTPVGSTIPTGSLYNNTYVAVHATGNGNGNNSGTAVFTLDPNQHSFAFTWGTIDDHNTLIVTTTNGTFTIAGTDLLTAISGTTGDDQNYIDVTDAFGTITSVTFRNFTQNAFEVANFYESTVPLPATLSLFGMALLGLGFMARRRQVKAIKA